MTDGSETIEVVLSAKIDRRGDCVICTIETSDPLEPLVIEVRGAANSDIVTMIADDIREFVLLGIRHRKGSKERRK